MSKSKYFRIFGTDETWLDIGDLRFNIFNNGNRLRIGNPKITIDESDLYDLEKSIKKAVPFLELMFGKKIISISNNGFGRGGTCVDIVFSESGGV